MDRPQPDPKVDRLAGDVEDVFCIVTSLRVDIAQEVTCTESDALRLWAQRHDLGAETSTERIQSDPYRHLSAHIEVSGEIHPVYVIRESVLERAEGWADV